MTNAELRVARERDFHNHRFEGGDDRTAQLKYYWALAKGESRFEGLKKTHAAGARVLDYGCGGVDNSVSLGAYKTFDAIDISDAAIQRLNATKTSRNASFHVMDAHAMTFADNSFDLIYGSGIIHHLDIERSAADMARVLAPGGVALFWEPLGYNPLINLYRKVTPNARTPDEHPLVGRDFKQLRRWFRDVSIERYGLLSLLAVPFRRQKFGPGLLRALEAIDAQLLKTPLKSLAWYSILVLKDPVKA